MSAALVLMITDGQDTQKRTDDLQQPVLCHRPGVASSGRSSQEASDQRRGHARGPAVGRWKGRGRL